MTPATTVTKTCSALSLSACAAASAISPIDRLDVGGLDRDDRRRSAFSTASATDRHQHRVRLGQVLRASRGRFSATTRSLTCRPARSSPDSSASPMLPPPMIAILAMRASIAAPRERRLRRHDAGGTIASWRVCTMMRPSQSTTMWSSSNQSWPICIVVHSTRSQPSAGSAAQVRGELHGRRPAEPVHRRTSPAPTRRRTSARTARRAPSPRAAPSTRSPADRRPSAARIVVSDGRMSQPCAR